MPEFDKTTGFMMDGSEFYGHGNQKRKNGMPYKDMNIGEKLKKKYGGTKQTTDKEGKKIYGDDKITEHKYTHKDDPKKDWAGHGPGRGDIKEGYPKTRKLTQEERSDWVEEDAFESSGGFNP